MSVDTVWVAAVDGTPVPAGSPASRPRRLLATLLVSIVTALSLVVGVAAPSTAGVLPGPIVTIISSLAGTVAATEGGTAATAGAATTAEAAGGAVGIAAIGAFAGGYYGTSWVLHWAFDHPPVAGAQPSANVSLGYLTSGGGSYDPLGAGTWKAVGACRPTGSVFDPAATGYANNNSGCFASGNTVANPSTSSVSLTFPAWRCKVSDCSASVKIVFPLNPDTPAKLESSGLTVSGFSGVSGLGASHIVSAVGPAISGRTYYGWDVWYDSAKIEFSPPPVSSFVTTLQCRKTSDGTTTTTTKTSANFYTGADAASLDLAPALSCAAGSLAMSSRIDICGGGGAAPCRTVQSWTGNSRVYNPSPTDPYKDCLPTGANAPCLVKLYKWTADGWKLCDQSTDCHTFDPSVNWSPNRWRCMWGNYVVATSDCSPMQSWAASTSVNDATDPDSSPTNDPAWVPDGSTSPGTGPSTGPSTGPTTGTNPFPSEGSNPSTVPVDPAVPDPNSQDCWGSVWEWGPTDFVTKPVECALLWAFRPSPGFMDTQVGIVKAYFDESTPGQYVGAVAGAIPELPGDAACEGISFHIPLGLDGASPDPAWDGHLGGACPGEALYTPATITKVVLSAVVMLGAVWECARFVALGFGFNIGIKAFDRFVEGEDS